MGVTFVLLVSVSYYLYQVSISDVFYIMISTLCTDYHVFATLFEILSFVYIVYPLVHLASKDE